MPSDGAHSIQARRLRRLPRTRVAGVEVPVASTRIARLMGLAWLPRERAGTGLLLPRCRSVHTLGMRFAIDVVFLDEEGRVLRTESHVGPGRFVAERRAGAILELPARYQGER